MLYLPLPHNYTKSEENLYIRVINCCAIALDKELIYHQHFLENYEILYVQKGEVRLTMDNRSFSVKSGEALILPYYKTVREMRPAEGGVRLFLVEFSCSEEIVSGLLEHTVEIRENSYFFDELFTRMNRAMTENRGEDYGNAALLLTILQVLAVNGVREEGGFSILSSVMEYINDHLDRMLSVEEIADHFNYNKDYIMKTFKAKYGITIKKYSNEKKLDIAKRLLTKTEMAIENVGASIGFDDKELFEKFFKYHEKMTPQRYRILHKQ